MRDSVLREIALEQAGKMRIQASHAEQMGLRNLSVWLRQNADAAMKWAARPIEKSSRRKRNA